MPSMFQVNAVKVVAEIDPLDVGETLFASTTGVELSSPPSLNDLRMVGDSWGQP